MTMQPTAEQRLVGPDDDLDAAISLVTDRVADRLMESIEQDNASCG